MNNLFLFENLYVYKLDNIFGIIIKLISIGIEIYYINKTIVLNYG